MIITHTVSLVEVIWTLVSLFGLYFNMHVLIRAAGDFLSVKVRRINSIREYAATTTLQLFITLVIVQLMFVVDGILAMTVPSPNNRVQPLSYVITASFVIVSFVLALLGFMQDRRRHNIVHMIRDVEIDDDHT